MNSLKMINFLVLQINEIIYPQINKNSIRSQKSDSIFFILHLYTRKLLHFFICNLNNCSRPYKQFWSSLLQTAHFSRQFGETQHCAWRRMRCGHWTVACGRSGWPSSLLNSLARCRLMLNSQKD